MMGLLILQGDLHPICTPAFATPPLFKNNSAQSLAARKKQGCLLCLFFAPKEKKKKKVKMFCVNVPFNDINNMNWYSPTNFSTDSLWVACSS